MSSPFLDEVRTSRAAARRPRLPWAARRAEASGRDGRRRDRPQIRRRLLRREREPRAGLLRPAAGRPAEAARCEAAGGCALSRAATAASCTSHAFQGASRRPASAPRCDAVAERRGHARRLRAPAVACSASSGPRSGRGGRCRTLNGTRLIRVRRRARAPRLGQPAPPRVHRDPRRAAQPLCTVHWPRGSTTRHGGFWRNGVTRAPARAIAARASTSSVAANPACAAADAAAAVEPRGRRARTTRRGSVEAEKPRYRANPATAAAIHRAPVTMRVSGLSAPN